MKTRLLFLAVAMTCSVFVASALAHIGLRVYTVDGGFIDYVVTNDMKVSLGENTLEISTHNGNITYTTAEFKSFSYKPIELITTDISDASADSRRVVISGPSVYAEGYEPGSHVSIVNLAGALVSDATVTGDMTQIADMDRLSPGVYIVSVGGNAALKFVVK